MLGLVFGFHFKDNLLEQEFGSDVVDEGSDFIGCHSLMLNLN
jgi:hypothetical protein